MQEVVTGDMHTCGNPIKLGNSITGAAFNDFMPGKPHQCLFFICC